MYSERILHLLGGEIRRIFEKTSLREEGIQEIRLRTGQPLLVQSMGQEVFLDKAGRAWSLTEQGYRVTKQDVTETLECLSSYSLYAYEEDIRRGFFTVQGGHRVGLAGRTVVEKEKIFGIRDISFLNIRISHGVKNCGEKLLPYVYRKGQPVNTLIVAPPGRGKTTVLRDLIRSISEGNSHGKGCSVTVIDERSEIGGCYLGMPQHDLGPRTDVLDGCPKAEGMLLMIRSMAPAMLAVDELAGIGERQAVLTALGCGVGILATAHGRTLQDIEKREDIGPLWEKGCFARCIFLADQGKPGQVKAVYDRQRGWLVPEEAAG